MSAPKPAPKVSYEVRPGRVTQVLDFRGSQKLPPFPAHLACDYCCVDSVYLVRREVRPFSLLVPRSGEEQAGFCFTGGTWNACRACDLLVEAGQEAGLVSRIVVLKREDWMRPVYSRLLSVVFRCFEEGEPRVWKRGERFP